MKSGYQIATFLMRKLKGHHDISNTSPDISSASIDPATYETIPATYSFIVICDGQGFEVSVRPIQLAS